MSRTEALHVFPPESSFGSDRLRKPDCPLRKENSQTLSRRSVRELAIFQQLARQRPRYQQYRLEARNKFLRESLNWFLIASLPVLEC
jgi:hypothetical protein